jgi:hypothetical protein
MQPDEPVGLYKARLVDADGTQRRFRLWLFAELPDHLHGEVISPIGTTELIVDAGDGQLAVAFVNDRVAFVGPAEPEVIEGLLGVRVGLEELVRALLTGEMSDPRHSVSRSETPGVMLPERLEIRSPRRALSLQLKRRQPLTTAREGLGRGRPPEGMQERGLDELDLLALPAVRE